MDKGRTTMTEKRKGKNFENEHALLQELNCKLAGKQLKGLSQEALAFKAGIDQSALSEIERLGPQRVSFNYLLRVTRELNAIVEINIKSLPEF
jgi:hypothetical protein